MNTTTSLAFAQLLAAAIAFANGLACLGLWLQYRRAPILSYTRAWMIYGASSVMSAMASPHVGEPGFARVLVLLAFVLAPFSPLFFVDAAFVVTTAQRARRLFWLWGVPFSVAVFVAFAINTSISLESKAFLVRLASAAYFGVAAVTVWRGPVFAGQRVTVIAFLLLLTRHLFGVVLAAVAPDALTLESQPLLFTMVLVLTTMGAGFCITAAIFSDEREATLLERLALEHEVANAQRMESLGHMAGSVAHDFNNILAALLTSSELATDAEASPDDRSFARREIGQAVARGKDLTRRLLAFGSPSAGWEQPYHPVQRVHELLPMLQRLAGANVMIAFDASRIDGGSRREAQGDPVRFDQLLLNLVANARDAMPSGGSIHIACEVVEGIPGTQPPRGMRKGPHLLIRVTDTGSGIPVALQDRIFEPFFTTKTDGKGTGLGLATAYAFVKSSEGLLSVESVEGTGSTFTIRLPLNA